MIKQNLLDTNLSSKYHVASLEKMLKNYENDPYEHYICRALAELFFEQGKDSIGLGYLNRSIESVSLDSYTKIENLKFLADHHLKKGNYVLVEDFLTNCYLFTKKALLNIKEPKEKEKILMRLSYMKKRLRIQTAL